MNVEYTKKLFDRFKMFHPELPPTQNLMCFGFECDDGWFDIIWRLCEDIEKIEPNFTALQVKEKYGGLRFYGYPETDEVWTRIELAENESYCTCEVCGKPGKPNEEGWIKTLCKEHRKEE